MERHLTKSTICTTLISIVVWKKIILPYVSDVTLPDLSAFIKHGKYAKCLQQILKIIEAYGNTNNLECLYLRQKIILQVGDMEESFIRKYSNISPHTVSSLKRKRKDNGSLPEPKRGGERTTPKKNVSQFCKFVDHPENSEIADSGIKPVLKHVHVGDAKSKTYFDVISRNVMLSKYFNTQNSKK